MDGANEVRGAGVDSVAVRGADVRHDGVVHVITALYTSSRRRARHDGVVHHHHGAVHVITALYTTS